jgi:acetylornithine deacetylase/succinyl-diaminopimelate desuccinylase-like protein
MLKVNRGEVVNLLTRLIEIESVNPNMEGGTGESKIAGFIAGQLESIGMEGSLHTRGN